MKYDYKTLYEKNSQFLTAKKGAKKAVIICGVLLPYFFAAAYLLLWIYGFFQKSFLPTDFLKLFFLPATCLLLTTFVGFGSHRPRPYTEEGANITPFKDRKWKDSSFPCGIVAFATTLSLLLLVYLTAVGVLCCILSLLLAYCRFALGWNYPSDVLGGYLFGGAIGCLVFFL